MTPHSLHTAKHNTVNSCPQNYKFTGYERDSETGLDYAFARYYNSRLARFTSPDPLSGSLRDPQTTNRYAYVRNNPTNLGDPTGMIITLQQSESWFGLGGGGGSDGGIFNGGFFGGGLSADYPGTLSGASSGIPEQSLGIFNDLRALEAETTGLYYAAQTNSVNSFVMLSGPSYKPGFYTLGVAIGIYVRLR